MKNCIKAVSLLLIVVLFFGCSKDSPTPAPAEVVKTKVKITKIDINSIPSTNGGVSWDSFDNPDIYIKCYDELGNLLIYTDTLWNFIPSVSSSFSATLTSTLSTTDLTNTIFKVQAWDDDSDLANSDDKIGEVPFYIHDYTIGANKYPSYAVKSDGLGTVVTIYMTWE
jgi:hypothetical protein